MSFGAGAGVGVRERAGVGGRRAAGGRVGAGAGVRVCAQTLAHLSVGLGFGAWTGVWV